MPKQSSPPSPERYKDGFAQSLGGVNSDLDPIELMPNELSWGVNIRNRGGFPETRPGLNQRFFIFSDPSLAIWFGTKLFQGAKEYVADEGADFHITSVGGRIFKVDIANEYTVTEITPTKQTGFTADQISPPIGGSVSWLVDDATDILIGIPVMIGGGHYMVTSKLNNLLNLTNVDAVPGIAIPAGSPVIYLDVNPSILPKVWYVQAKEYLVIQDGQSNPIIFDGSGCRRAGPDEVLVGKQMAFHRNRIWVSVNGDLVIAGDIMEPNNHASALKFTEFSDLSLGGIFMVDGEITAISEIPVPDTSLGQGPLQVITENSFNSFDLPTQRALWKSITTPFQTVSIKNSGAVGQDSLAIVNSDLWYRDPEGNMRSFQITRREAGEWNNAPMSSEMSRTIKDEEKSLLEFTSSVVFDQRLLFTVTPSRVDLGGAYFNGIVSLDFNPMGAVKRKQAPIYDGLWTGIHPYQLLTTKINKHQKCFAYTNEPTGIGLWEISKDDDFDGDGGRIQSFIEFPTFKFGRPGAVTKMKLQSFKAFVSNLVGIVDFTLRWRPDDAECWLLWNTRKKCATGRSCAVPDGCNVLTTFKAGYRPHMGFGLPPDDQCSEFGINARYGYSFQMRLEIVGRWKLKRVLSTADEADLQPLGEEDSDDE